MKNFKLKRNLLLTTFLSGILITPLNAAGGLSRDGNDVSFMFNEGSFFEISLKSVTPSITGSSYTPLGLPTDIPTSVGEEYSTYNINYKQSLTDKTALGFQVRTPIGADVLYPSGSALSGISVDYDSSSLSLMGLYKQNKSFSLLGGLYSQSQNGNVLIPFPNNYSATASKDTGTGIIAGASYSIPEIALKASFSYFSEISTSHATIENGVLETVTDITSPSGWNIDFETGIAANTLAFASVNYQDWDKFVLDPVGFRTSTGDALYDPESVTTYTLGLGRKFTDTLAGYASYTLKEETDGTASALAPTDGYYDVSIGLRYTIDKIDFGVGGTMRTYTNDVATTQEILPGVPIGNFTNNTLSGVGVSIKYNY